MVEESDLILRVIHVSKKKRQQQINFRMWCKQSGLVFDLHALDKDLLEPLFERAIHFLPTNRPMRNDEIQ